MAVTLTDIQKVTCTITVVDAAGNAAPVEGVPVWTSDDETVATVAAAADGLSADIVATGVLGVATVTVEADADLGDGVDTITGDLLVDVIASEATGITIVAGEPVAK